MKPVPLLVPDLPNAQALLPYLVKIDENRKYTNFGPLNSEFEARICAALARPGQALVALTVANCTLGIELALQAAGVKPGDQVLIPSITFVATATAVLRIGAIPVFAEVDPDSWCLSPEIARTALRTFPLKAIVPVSTFGCPLDTAAWDAFVVDTKIPVVVDAAGAWGNQYVGEQIDVVYSFHATKSFGIGEGGAIVSTNADRIARIKRLSNFGLDTSRSVLVEIGTNAKLSEYHCAVGLAAFDQWQATRSARVDVMARYLQALQSNCPSLAFQRKPSDGVYPLLPLLLPPSHPAADVIKAMAARSIECRRWYCPPLYQHDALATYPRMQDTAVAEDLGTRILGIPFFLAISAEQIDHVTTSLATELATPAARRTSAGSL